MSIIEATGICKTYHRGREEVCALKGVDLSIEPGEFVSIVGPSGAGKTALMNILGCLDAPSCGTLMIDGVQVTGKGEAELVKIRRDHIGFVFQQFFLIPTLTVGENVGLPLIFSGIPYDRARIDSLLDKVGLSHRAGHLPGQLSGGEMQRVAIARALVNKPRILLADEPTGNLDSVTADGIYGLFDDLHRQGITVIVVTHNRELAQRAGRVITIRDGCVERECGYPHVSP
ncbi:ABC transporter ATP-binding protein [Methanoregula sp. PtaB.Bin085]|uniref:ABC transporter ATP-binding protein n=1 Tax=Methanoregula sp. PtaB.Bin085 TaxID=1811680 RepID=UPI0009D5392C|nr:ABC transporter ATP-binding protein [Methanoregula sp. PtaB.Bin085]OPX63422.1 MAG: putative ABC transporter ATP-binding protein [Methanoregula sp. PtaB.Bin085]